MLLELLLRRPNLALPGREFDRALMKNCYICQLFKRFSSDLTCG